MGLLVDELEEPRTIEQEYRSTEGVQTGIQSKGGYKTQERQ